MIIETTKYAVACDHKGCSSCTDDEESEHFAKVAAKEAGFVFLGTRFDTKVYCAKHVSQYQR